MNLTQDIRLAFRLLARQPGHALVTVLTMALGIGATTVLFSVTWGVLMKPLPWPGADRLVRVNETRQGSTRRLPPILTNGTYLSWKESPATVEAIGAWSPGMSTVIGASGPERIPVVSMTASLLPTLRVAPAAGRAFTDADELASDGVLLSHGYAQQRFGGATAIGQRLQIDGKPYTVVGVMPADFFFPDRDVRAWVPFRVQPVKQEGGRTYISVFRAIARLAPGMTPAQASQEATARGRSAPDPGMTAIALFGSRGLTDATATPLLPAMTADVKPALLVLLGAVGLLLVAATANIASIQLARAATRRREIAIRAALGASGGRLVRSLLVEHLLVGLIGGLAGLAIAATLHRALPSLLPVGFPRAGEIAIDWRVMVFALGASLVASLGFGLTPALHARALNLVEGLVADVSPAGRGYRRSPTARARAAIMAGQVAVACVLIVGAALLVRTFVNMLGADRGYNPENVMTARVVLPDATFTAQRRAAFVDRLLERLQGQPDLVAASVTTVLPLGTSDALMGFRLPPRRGSGDPVQAQAAVRTVSPAYFAALGLRIVQGRALQPSDSAASLPVMVVNRAFAKRYVEGDPIGQRIPVGFDEARPDWEIVGIVEDVVMRSLTDPPQPEMFVSYRQMSAVSSDPIVVVRTRSDPGAAAATIRQIVAGEDPTVALDQVMTMEQRLVGSLAQPRLFAVVLAAFAGFTLAIAGVGLFGVLSFAVSQRSREIGIRAALGARPADIVRLVVRDGLTVTAAGIAIGLGVSLAVSRSVATLLYGVSAHDLATFAAVPVLLLAVAAVACFVPARRAAKLDPLRVLRAE